jgi:hypothetical protein
MRIAILMGGQARYIKQSAEWWNNRIFPKEFRGLTVDYFFNLWEEDQPEDLVDQIHSLWPTAKAVELSSYNTAFHHNRHLIKTANREANDWHLVNDYCKHLICYYGDEIDQFAYNFPGMYLSSAKVAKTFEPFKDKYDVVIKTRTDCFLNPMAENHWLNITHNMLRNPVFSDCIFTPWLRIRNGLPFMGDLCFIGKPKLMQKFLINIDEQYRTVCTDDKHLLSDFLVDPEIPMAHWLWSRLSIYSKTDWLALSVVWPTPFNSALLRHDTTVYDKDFQWIEKSYNQEEQRRHDELAHEIGKSQK